MNLFAPKTRLSFVTFLAISGMAIVIALFYFYNIIKWSDLNDRGWGSRSAVGVNIVSILSDSGRRAGLKINDKILKINDIEFKTRREQYDAMKNGTNAENLVLVERDGEQLEVTVISSPRGFKKVFFRSGTPFLLGLCYVMIGTLVFWMKPHRSTSWTFFLFCATFGTLLVFLYRSGPLDPSWLGSINIFAYVFSPATIVHLTFTLPEKRKFIERHPYTQLLPYLASAMLFAAISRVASGMFEVPIIYYKMLVAYLVLSIMGFMISCLYSWLRSPSVIARVRAKLILFGTLLTASVPLLDTATNIFFHFAIVPGFHYFLPFLIIFPLSIAYSITKHNLFDITAVIRQTFGYLLLTAGIAILYFLVVVVISRFLGDIWQKQSHLLFLAILMAVMLSFGFVRKRVQSYVDRIFFRMDFDYKETVSRIGTAMRSLINIDQVVTFMRDIAENVLYAGTSYVMLLNREKNAYECATDSCSMTSLPAGEPLVRKIAEQKREITRYDIDEHPLFAIDRERCKKTFNSLGVSLIVPLIYEDNLSGFMALGKKKSGKIFKYEDVLLLKTLANQGAMAIENARLFTDLEGQTETLLKTNIKLEQEIDQRKKAEAELNKYKRQLEKKVEKQTVELDRSRKALADLKGDIKRGHRFGKIIGKSEPMQVIYALIQDLADVPATVLITGESGTGKELVAEALHTESQRKDHPFVKVNCSALSESVLESELFGHVKGAFTGADKNKIGRFQKAADGTILLDEIGDVSLNFQKRLLRVLQEREFERLGDATTLSMDARIIAATNQNLLERVKQGEFRQDLYYRLKVVEIKLPPLRERKEDILLMIHHFLGIFNEELGKKIESVSPEILRILMAYHWPGNVRELRNTLEHICILCKNTTIVEDDLPSDFPGHDLSYDQSFQVLSNKTPPSSETLPDDKETLLKALEQAQWNKTRAAEILGISRRTLYRRLKEYQI